MICSASQTNALNKNPGNNFPKKYVDQVGPRSRIFHSRHATSYSQLARGNAPIDNKRTRKVFTAHEDSSHTGKPPPHCGHIDALAWTCDACDDSACRQCALAGLDDARLVGRIGQAMRAQTAQNVVLQLRLMSLSDESESVFRLAF